VGVGFICPRIVVPALNWSTLADIVTLYAMLSYCQHEGAGMAAKTAGPPREHLAFVDTTEWLQPCRNGINRTSSCEVDGRDDGE
jgi:hypothetical protein